MFNSFLHILAAAEEKDLTETTSIREAFALFSNFWEDLSGWFREEHLNLIRMALYLGIMFEPIGGSAPKYTGKNVINPLAAIGAAAMMLDFLGEKDAAAAIDNAIAYVTGNKLKSMAAGKMGYSTTEVGDLVAANL